MLQSPFSRLNEDNEYEPTGIYNTLPKTEKFILFSFFTRNSTAVPDD